MFETFDFLNGYLKITALVGALDVLLILHFLLSYYFCCYKKGYLIDLLDDFVKDPENKYSIIPPMLSAGEGEKGGAVSSYNEALLEREKLIKSSTTDNPLSEIANNQVDKLRQGVVQSISNMKIGLGRFEITRKKDYGQNGQCPYL